MFKDVLTLIFKKITITHHCCAIQANHDLSNYPIIWVHKLFNVAPTTKPHAPMQKIIMQTYGL